MSTYAKLVCTVCGKGNARTPYKGGHAHQLCVPELMLQRRRATNKAAAKRQRERAAEPQAARLARITPVGLRYRTTLAPGAAWPYPVTT